MVMSGQTGFDGVIGDDAIGGEAAWRAPAETLDETNLRALIAGEIPVLRIRDFATVEECRTFCDAIRRNAADGKAASTARMSLIGVNFSNYGGATKAGYFEQVAPSYATVGAILGEAGFDPLERMLERLRAIWPASVGVASEPGFGSYFAGGIKTRASSGNLHYDFAPHTAAGYAIARITDQLGWNLYLDMPPGTGETTAYRRPVPRDGGKAGSGAARALNLERGYVEGAEAFTFQPRIGEVAIINTRYPHDITVENAAPGSWRAQTSSFVGRLPDDRLILWS
jgi:hypothetical protein